MFPRVINGRVCNWDYEANVELVPEEVMKATVEEAIALYDFYVSSPGDQKRRKLQDQGVKSFSVGKLSESYGNMSTSAKWKGLHSQEAYDFMKQYIAGAVRPIP
jgi:phosphopentomutase